MSEQEIEGSNAVKGLGVPFEGIRRVTGYISTLDRWNTAKFNEQLDRVHHGI